MKMAFNSKATSFRPERIFIEDDNLIVEYSIQNLKEVGEKVRHRLTPFVFLGNIQYLSRLFNHAAHHCQIMMILKSSKETKQYRLYPQEIDDKVDISKLARKIIKKCKYIPPQWLSQVEDLLIEMRETRSEERTRSLLNHADPKRSFDENINEIERNIIVLLDLCYGDTSEQLKASNAIISLCQYFSQLEAIANHHELISAFTRMLTDKTRFSVELIFNVVKFFLLLADYSEFHPILIEYKVGSIIMSLAGRIISGLADSGEFSSGSNEYTCRIAIFNVCISILIRLSDDIDILRKMTKKGIASLLDFISTVDLPEWPLGHVLYLFQRASIFEEVIRYCRDDQSKHIEGIVSLLSNKSKEIIIERSLKILYNLSFDKDCCGQMLFYGLPRRLSKLSRHAMTWKLVYQISTHAELRKCLLVQEWEAIIKKVAIDPSKYAINEAEVVHAILINFTHDPLWAEMMIPLTSYIMKSIQKSKCVMQVKMLRNLSKWTHGLQEQIGMIGMAHDHATLESMTRYPDKYVTHGQGASETNQTSDVYEKYKSLRIWEESIPHFVALLSSVEDEHLILELLATFNRLTIYDLPSSSWHTLIGDASLLRFIHGALIDENISIDLVLEIIILCTEISTDDACLKLLLDNHIISKLLMVWDDCGDDEEIHLHLLTLCESVLFYEESRSNLLLGSDAIQNIIESVNHRNRFIQEQAIRCLDAIDRFHALDEDDIGEHFSALAKDTRFNVYNAAWIETINTPSS